MGSVEVERLVTAVQRIAAAPAGRFLSTNPNGHLILDPPHDTTTSLITQLITLTQTQPTRAGPKINNEHRNAA